MKFPATVLFTSHYDHARMGGQKSLLALVEHLDRTKIKPLALVTAEGELAEKLRALDCQTTTFSLPDARRGYFVNRWTREAKNFFETVKKVNALIATHRIDLLHPDEEDDAVTCIYGAKGTAAKVVYHARVTGKHKLDGIIETRADGLTGVSDGARQRFSTRGLKKYRTVYDGIDCNVFKPVDDAAVQREQLGLPTDKFVVLFVGQIKPEKGVLDLIDALWLLRQSASSEQAPLLLVAGIALQNNFMSQLQTRISQLRLNDHVRFLGQRSDVHIFMQAADVIALPSHEGVEGLPRVLFEGMACGAVPLGTAISGIAEVIEPDAGFLVPERAPKTIAETLSRVMNDKEQLARLRLAAVKSATKRFDIRAHARAVEQFYADLQ